MITIKNNKVYLSESEYKILKDLYDAFRLDSYALTLFNYGVKSNDIKVDPSLLDTEDPKDIYYEILKTVVVDSNYELINEEPSVESQLTKLLSRRVERLQEEVNSSAPMIIKAQEINLILEVTTKLKQLYDTLENELF